MFVGSTLPLFKDVHWSAKHVLKIFAFLWKSAINLLSIKIDGIIGMFLPLQNI